MRAIRVFQLIPRRVLVARGTAREIAAAIEDGLGEAGSAIELDFEGIEAVTPSFVDEVLGVIQAILDRKNLGLDRILVSHPPTRLSSKFEAVGRGRNLLVTEQDDGAWVITPAFTQGSRSSP